MALHAEMACREFVELVTPYLERRLDTMTTEACEEHALVCPGCDTYLEQIREVARRLRRDDASAPESNTVPAPSGATVRAYKFLRAGAVAPFGRTAAGAAFSWPTNAWVGGDGVPARICVTGVHACTVGQLPYWLNDELWVVELAGDLRSNARKLVASLGRLVAQVPGWSEQTRRTFGAACGERVRAHAVAALRRAGYEREANEVADAPSDGLRAVVKRIDPRRAPGAYAALTYASDACEFVDRSASVAYIAAVAAAHAADMARASALDAESFERRWQADWLRRELGLPDQVTT